MHFEVLVEDQSGKEALEIIIPKIIGTEDSFKVHPYKGIGSIPKNLKKDKDPSARLLLNKLPMLLRGYGNTFSNYPKSYRAAVIVVCDLDDKCKKEFLEELNEVLNSCDPKPLTCFCLAIEEGEAWFLGDIPAIKQAYPKAKDMLLNRYVNDSICGTWELLADAVFPGGHTALAKKGWIAVGTEKSTWAKKISPYMEIDSNKSPSFTYFRDKLIRLAVAPS